MEGRNFIDFRELGQKLVPSAAVHSEARKKMDHAIAAVDPITAVVLGAVFDRVPRMRVIAFAVVHGAMESPKPRDLPKNTQRMNN